MADDPFAYRETWQTPCGELDVRPIEPGDEEDLLCFFRERLSPRSNLYLYLHVQQTDEEALAAMRKRIAAHQRRDALVYVALREGAIVGYFFVERLHSPEGRLLSLGIGLADALHGCGIGGRFMDVLIQGARDLDCAAIELTHYPENTRAAALYRRKGFRYTGEHRSWQTKSGTRTEPVMVLRMRDS